MHRNRSEGRRAVVSPGIILAGMAVLVLSTPAQAQWPQWGGPQRNFKVSSAELADRWPEQGPKRLWQRPLGDGYATIAVTDGKLITMYRKDGSEFTICLDAASGTTVWEQGQAVAVTPPMEQFGAGPHATPLVDGAAVYSVGITGVLQCLDTNTGTVRWRHDLPEAFGMEVPGRGYSSSPIAYQNTIILPVGGKPGQALMAFDKTSGAPAWKGQDFGVTHSSPILIDFEHQPQLVVFMAEALAGVNPADGTLLWQHAHPTQFGANLATPVWDGRDTLFCSAAYDSGSRCVKLVRQDGKTVAQEQWYSQKMRVHHGNVILEGGHAYGSSGDFGPAFFMCADLTTGKLNWRERGFAKATCVYAGGKMIILDQDGQLALATVDPQGMNVVSRCTVAEPYAWAAPTLVGSTLYLRDRKHIMALAVGP